MKYTKEKIKLLDEIALSKIETIYDLYKFHNLKTTKRMNKGGSISANEKSFNTGTELNTIDENDKHKWFLVINQFDSIRVDFVKKGFVNIIEYKTGSQSEFEDIFYYNREKHTYAAELSRRVSNYKNFHIYPTQVLLDFINNGYCTDDEIMMIEERNSRMKAEKWTKNIAITSILISLLSTIGTCVFNYLTYTKERDVIIKKIQNTEQPVRIEIISKENDSKKIDILDNNESVKE